MQQGMTHHRAPALIAMSIDSLLASLHPCRASTQLRASMCAASTSRSPSTSGLPDVARHVRMPLNSKDEGSECVW